MERLFLLLFKTFFLMSMDILLACMSVHPVHGWCPWRPEEGVGSPETKVTDAGEPP